MRAFETFDAVTRPILVQKYGGSSLATPARSKRVARRIAESQRTGHDVVAVVSAMGETTDRLLTLASRVAKDPTARELDLLLSTGEGVSAPLVSMALHELGVPAVSLLGFQAGIQTDRRHAKARIVGLTPARIERELAAGRVVVVAGFQYLREETKGTPSRKIASAVVMGAAVSAMHYTGMASASFMPSTVAPGLSHAASVSSLGNAGIVIVTLIVLVTVVLTSAVDRRLASQRG